MPGGLEIPKGLDFSNTQKAWPEYKRRFLRYRSASGLSEKPAQQQVDMLIYCMGEEAESIIPHLQVRPPQEADEDNNIPAEDADETLFDRTVEAFDTYFNPRDNHLHYAVLFGSRMQAPEESNDQFIRSLHEMAAKCTGWDQNHRDDMIRTRILAGMRDKDLSRELQLNANITLQQIQQQLRTKEIILANQKAEQDDHMVMAVRSTRPKTSPPAKYQHQSKSVETRTSGRKSGQMIDSCRYCGSSHVRGRCPAYGKRCKNCRRMGHFERVCESGHAKSDRGYNQCSISLEHDQASNSGDDDYFHVQAVSNTTCLNDRYVIPITIQGKTINARIDTAAAVSTMSKPTFLSIGCTRVTRTKAKLTGYGGSHISVIGRVKLPVVDPSGKESVVKFYVTDDDNETLIGAPAIDDLQLIRVKGSKVNQVTSNSLEMPAELSQLIAEYDIVFSGLGRFGKPVELELKSTAEPKTVPSRLVPHKLRKPLKRELDKLVKLGVIVRDTNPSQWMSPLVIVNKPNGDVRLCLDPHNLNQNLIRAQCAIPTTTEIFSKVSGSKYFTTLDANQSFHQIPLTETSSMLTSFLTPYGKFRYKRLPMGICNAPEIFHQRMADAVEDLQGVEVYIDDVLIHAATREEHDIRLRKVLDRFKQVGLTLNPAKVVFAKQSVGYLGHELSGKGIAPCHSKVEAIQHMVQPQDKKAVQRFLGFVTYLAKFIPNLADHTLPLREVMKKNVQFYWGPAQSEAFETIRNLIVEAPTLKLYDPEKPVYLSADSSKSSLGAVILQDGRPIEFAAKALTDCQSRYSQIEKELLASLFACKRFKYYCLGQKTIEVETDHLPLLGLMNKPINELSPRLAAMRLELLPYPIALKYCPGSEMVLADTLSRSCPAKMSQEDDLGSDPLLSVCSVVIRSADVMTKYQKATLADEELQVVMRYIQEGWPSHKKSCASRALRYFNLRHSLSIVNDVVFYGRRLVVPVSLQSEVVDTLHCAHQGVTKTLQRASNSVFWPGLRHRLEEKCRSCEPCMSVERNERKEPLIPFAIPAYPFQTLGVDLFAIGGKSYLMMVDYLTKWPVVKQLGSGTGSAVVIECLREVFSDFGQPESIVSDNGPQFSSQEFKRFCSLLGIVHNTSSPLHPSGNGQVERAIGTVKGMMKKCIEDGSSWLTGLTTLRNTPIASSLPSPAELLQGRYIRDSLPVCRDRYQVTGYSLEHIREKLGAIKSSNKHYHDSHAGPLKTVLKPGQQVYYKAAQGRWRPGVIAKILGERSYEIDAGAFKLRRNRKDLRESQVKDKPTRSIIGLGVRDSITDTPSNSSDNPNDLLTNIEPEDTSAMNCNIEQAAPTVPAMPAGESHEARPMRVHKKPIWHKDYDFRW